MSSDSVLRLSPFSFIHILDNNTNITRVEIGPKTFVRQEHEKITRGPEKMIHLPPQH